MRMHGTYIEYTCSVRILNTCTLNSTCAYVCEIFVNRVLILIENINVPEINVVPIPYFQGLSYVLLFSGNQFVKF